MGSLFGWLLDWLLGWLVPSLVAWLGVLVLGRLVDWFVVCWCFGWLIG